MFIDERNRNTKKTGKRPWTASVEPVRNAAQLPSDANASAITVSSSSSIAAPPMPLCQTHAEREADGEIEERLDDGDRHQAAELPERAGRFPAQE